MDQGIIAAFKKRYKFSLLREVIAFHDNTDEEKRLLVNRAQTVRRGAAGLQFGNLLDAARISVASWNDISPTTIRNCFRKAEINIRWEMDTHVDSTDIDDEPSSDGLISSMISLKLIEEDDATEMKKKIEEVLHLDDPLNPEWIQSLLKEEKEEQKPVDIHLSSEEDSVNKSSRNRNDISLKDEVHAYLISSMKNSIGIVENDLYNFLIYSD